MKTFEEFSKNLEEESAISQIFKHYVDVYKRNTEPHPARKRRMKAQNLIDQYRLYQGIADDSSIPVGKRKKAEEKAKQILNDLKKEMEIA